MANAALQERAAGALMGAFIGDALALGPHWYYDLDELRRDYGEWITGYTDPKPGRYHAGLKAGQLSQAGFILALLLRSLVACGRYDEGDFCQRLDEELLPLLDGTPMTALALKRQLGVSYPTAWRIQHKIMPAMTERDAQYTRCGEVRVDDADLGGERVGGKAGRGSENEAPFVAAVSLKTEGHPLYPKMIPGPGFTGAALTDWANAALAPGSQVISDGLSCFTGVTAAGCDHQAMIIGRRKPNQGPEFGWLNTILGNLKTRFSGTYHAFDFAK